jgi:GNAT superfamily N-acetyltransferase
LSQAAEFVDFHNSYYGTARHPDNWIWQYKSYEPDKAIFFTVRDGGRLIGTQGIMPVYMKIGEEVVLTGKSESSLLLPDYRGKNIMAHLYASVVRMCEEKGYEFIWGFTSAVKAFRDFGFSVYPSVRVLSKPGLDFFAGLASRLQDPGPLWLRAGRAGKYGVFYLRNVKRLVTLHVERQGSYLVSKARTDLSQLRDLQTRLDRMHPSLITPFLDGRYLDWRIRNHPFLRYLEYQVTKGGKLQAYAFVALSKGVVSLSDFVSVDNHAASILLSKIIKDNQGSAGHFHTLLNPYCAPGEEIMELCLRYGFSSSCPVAQFVVRDIVHRNHKDAIRMAKCHHVSGLWTEGYNM